MSDTPKPELVLDTQPNLRLKQMMDEMGYTQAEVAERIGRNFTTINKYVSPSPREIPEGILLLLQARLGFAKKYIEFGTGPKFVKPELFIPFAEVPLITSSGRIAYNGLDSLPSRMPTYRLYETTVADAEGCVVVEITARDNMGDQLKPTAKVLARRIEPAQWDQSTGVVVVRYQINNLVVKRIIDNTLPIDNRLVLHADGPKGGSFSLHHDVIQDVFQVLHLVYGPVD